MARELGKKLGDWNKDCSNHQAHKPESDIRESLLQIQSIVRVDDLAKMLYVYIYGVHCFTGSFVLFDKADARRQQIRSEVRKVCLLITSALVVDLV